MTEAIRITLKGIFRDKIFQGIMVLAVMIMFIPTVASLSMRQVTELSITLSLSLISFIMLLLSVFLGATSLWKDIERRYTFSVLSLPVSRITYIVGRFAGIAIFMLITASLLGIISMIAIKSATMIYPPSRPVAWGTIVVSILFDSLKYILLVAVSIMLSSVSTSFFLPIFGTISTFLVGTVSQQVYDYLHTPSAQKDVAPLVKQTALSLYYVLPNLDSFDLKLNAIYALPLNWSGLALTVLYFVVYTSLLLACGALIFGKREMK